MAGTHSSRIVQMDSPPNSLYQWLNFCASMSWKSYIRDAFCNDNRLYLEDARLSVMHTDIQNIHSRAGLPAPVFCIAPVPPEGEQRAPASPASTAPPDDGSASASPSAAVTTLPDPLSFRLLCYKCGATSATTKAWKDHRRIVHLIPPACEQLIDGHVCKVCLKPFFIHIWHQ